MLAVAKKDLGAAAKSIAYYDREGYPDAADLSMFRESIAKGGS